MWNLVCTWTLCTVSHYQGCSFRLHCWNYVCLRKKLREAEVEGCTRTKHSLNNQGLVGDIDDLTSKEETRFDPQVEGGESTFLDSFHVAEELRTRHPEDFESLVRIPATFQKIHFGREYPVKLVYKRPHIVLNSDKEIVGVIWSPAFEGPLLVPEEDVEPYFKAYRTFTKMLNDSPIQKSLKMAPGDLVCFNNRRILHGRKSFNLNGGVRHLKGCYVNIDEFRSTFQVMSELISSGEPCKRVGNQCFL